MARLCQPGARSGYNFPRLRSSSLTAVTGTESKMQLGSSAGSGLRVSRTINADGRHSFLLKGLQLSVRPQDSKTAELGEFGRNVWCLPPPKYSMQTSFAPSALAA